MTCTNCGKPLRKDNKSGYCNSVERGCRKAERKTLFTPDEVLARENAVLNCLNCGAPMRKLITRSRSYCERTLECRTLGNFQSLYGITKDEKHQLWAAQGGLCAFGGETLLYEKAHLDHAHGHHAYKGNACRSCIRGVVCNGHNQRHIAVLDELGWLESWSWYRDRRPLLEKK